ncbi:hypothetical protein JCM10908_001589 [Rhodotorula pacifica]|uniref:uncharacterized protein n=1 Tax=Rhodotorula pacifica TaxID=1495444 RepID=UPI0031785128
MLLCATRPVTAGEDMSITAPTSIQPGSEVTISWAGGSATFTVRILVNSHESSETKSVATSSFTWSAEGVKNGDQVQFYIYDSSGASTKSPQVPVVQAKSDAKQGEGGSKSSGSMQTGTGDVDTTSKPTGKVTAADAGADKTTPASTTGTRSGRIPTAPPQSPYTAASSATSLAESDSADTTLSVTSSDASALTTSTALPTSSPTLVDSATSPQCHKLRCYRYCDSRSHKPVPRSWWRSRRARPAARASPLVAEAERRRFIDGEFARKERLSALQPAERSRKGSAA